MSFCSKCGTQLADGTVYCPKCGKPVQGQPVERRSLGDDAGMRFVLPVGCTGWAIACGYCGLFSIIPVLGCALAILSLLFGFVAVRISRTNEHKHGVARIVIGWIFAIPSLIAHVLWASHFFQSV